LRKGRKPRHRPNYQPQPNGPHVICPDCGQESPKCLALSLFPGAK
jgi:hypothetical protein